MFAGNFAPMNWAFCSGQTLQIIQNSALYSILGTTYGGNGTTTFNLPDLRGRVPIHPGSGPGLTPHSLGQMGGTESVALTTTQMPAHNHLVTADANGGSQAGPGGGVPAVESTGTSLNYSAAGSTTMAPGMVANAGSGTAHPNVQPYTCVNFIICLQGLFPTRS